MTRILCTTLMMTTLLGGTAFAQDAVPEAAPPVPAEAVPPVPAPPAPPAPEPMAPTPMMEATTTAAPVSAAPSTDSGVKMSMFADSYYNFSTSKNSGNKLFPGTMETKPPSHRAYERHNGFGLSFLGADLTYDTEKFGATASLRFGPSVPIFYAENKSATGIENITQAFVTWKPATALSIDFGQFTTIYGAEVAESWKNLNYTRGGLYYAMQPFWHTGVRAKYAVTSELTLTGMVVNGVNNEIDGGKERPSLGAQAAYTTPEVAVLLGYLGSLDPDTDLLFDHFVDLVATAAIASTVNVVFNADYAKDGDTAFFGASLAARLALTDEFGIALRAEYLGDPDGIIWGPGDNNVLTGTGTLDFKPGASGKLIIRWDNRFEKSNKDIFTDRDGAGKDTWFQSVLGVVVTSA